MAVLEKLTSPNDVKKLNNEELKVLGDEIRTQILDVTKVNGGHLSSNLGIVETTIALFKNFNLEKDKIIFDVGHQCYAHKILSGRKDKFSSIRLENGISGFPDIKESALDAFGTGHAGTSISAGLGYCTARDKIGEDYFVISVVGDGALSNGLNLEALTSSNSKPKKFIVILNDNGMSISKNKNGFYRYISKETAKRTYVKGKRKVRKIFGENSIFTKALVGIRNFIKRIIKKSDYFESHGFKYVGVVDGNDINKLNKILSDVKYASNDKAIFLHLKTTKGKGFVDAEENASLYHGVSAKYKSEVGDFASSLGNTLCSLIEKDDKIVAITAGMKDGTGLKKVEERFPKNFFDVGIAESFAVTYASGMAVGGLKPVVAIYSTFLQRAYDQVLHDVCLQNLPVVFCLDRAGVVGRDGKTHQGVYDLSYLSHLPNMTVLTPSNVSEFKDCLTYALSLSSPVAIRYPKDQIEDRVSLPISKGLWERTKEGNGIEILAVGPRMVSLANKVSLSNEKVGVTVVRSIKPLDEKVLDRIDNSLIITLEENSLIGGFGEQVLSYYNKTNKNVKVVNLGIRDCVVEHGDVENQLKNNGLTVLNIEEIIKSYK